MTTTRCLDLKKNKVARSRLNFIRELIRDSKAIDFIIFYRYFSHFLDRPSEERSFLCCAGFVHEGLHCNMVEALEHFRDQNLSLLGSIFDLASERFVDNNDGELQKSRL